MTTHVERDRDRAPAVGAVSHLHTDWEALETISLPLRLPGGATVRDNVVWEGWGANEGTLPTAAEPTEIAGADTVFTSSSRVAQH